MLASGWRGAAAPAVPFLVAVVFLSRSPGARAESSEAQAAEWVSRFCLRAPEASEEGICEPRGSALPVFTVTPAAAGRQLVRVSLPFAAGSFPAELGLAVQAGPQRVEPDVQVLTWHPGRPRSVRRAFVTFTHDFADRRAQTFQLLLAPAREKRSVPASQPGVFEGRIGATALRITAEAVEVERAGRAPWRAECVAPSRAWSVVPVTEVIARGENYLWVRLLVPDERWPRIIEVRADVPGTVAVRLHVQRLEPTPGVVARAPDLGWRISGLAADAILSVGAEVAGDRKRSEHNFAPGAPASIAAGDLRVDFPDAPLLRRGSVTLSRHEGSSQIAYLRCRSEEKVPQQYAAWRTATVVVLPAGVPGWTALLEPPHEVRIPSEAFDAIYGSGRAPDLSPWGWLAAANRFHIEAIARCLRPGDDFGNVASLPTGGVYGMNRLNHCPPIFEEYYRTGDARLRQIALQWCGNYHDLSIWWGAGDAARFGGTRYNNASRHDETVAQDPEFMWRSNSAVSFCTKGIDSFLDAYEETGDPRMATALRWQWDYARREVHADRECRNIGDAADFLRLHRFTGDPSYMEGALRLFRELRPKLSADDLFDQGGRPICPEPPFIDNDEDGRKCGFAKPYIIGYALLGLPGLAEYFPEEPKLLDVVRAVAGFQAGAQDPVGGWRYPHPRSSGVSLAQAMEHAAQLARAAAVLERRGEPVAVLLDAIERTLQARILGWQRSGKFLTGLGGWEAAAGVLKPGQGLADLYRRPEDRDRRRDYTEGAIGLGDAPPEGVVYFFEVLDFYLSRRPAERLLHAGESLEKVLARMPAGRGADGVAEPPEPSLRYGVADELPTFREALLERLTFPLAWDPAGGADFGSWRERARAKVFECLQSPPPRADFAPVVMAREDRGSYEARKLVFSVSADGRIPAYLLVPKGPGPFPAVVALHDHGAFFRIGKEKMVRPFGEGPEVQEAARQWVAKCYGGRFVGDALAERGYVVLAADALYWGERGRKEGVDYSAQQALTANLMQMGTTWLGVNTWDDIRGAEFVASLPQVDPARIGAIGLSMGCHRTWMLHALSDRIAAAVGVCWMGTTEALMTPGNNQTKGFSAYSMLAPDLRNFLDYADVASIACPKPLMIVDGGEKDRLFPVAGVDAAYARLRRVWDSQGVGDRLTTKRWDVGHVFDVPMQEEAFEWLDRWLNKPGPRGRAGS